MALTRAERNKRYRLAHPELVKQQNRQSWLIHKSKHPEIGTYDNPRRDTRFKPGDKPKPGAGKRFEPGHTINKGRTGWLSGKTHTEEARAKIRAARANQVITIEHRLRMSETMKARREKNHFWKGGITEINKKIRNSIEYRLWRESVFIRDNYTCVHCGKRGCKLHADHIQSFAAHPDLRFAIDNGRTLCVPCHKQTDTYLNKGRLRHAKIS